MFSRTAPKRQKGFTLIELAIVLGVIGVLSAGLWQLMSTGNQQSKDQVTAQQHLELINAVKSFMADGQGQTLVNGLSGTGAGTTAVINLPLTNASLADCQSTAAGHGYSLAPTQNDMCLYLPPGFTSGTTNPYGQTYSIYLLRQDGQAAGTTASSYSFMVIASGATIPDTDGGRISGLIGADGGFIYTSSLVCGGGAGTVCGSMGAWATTTGTYGAGAVPVGSIASRSFISTATDNSYQWLARVVIPGDSTYINNTMVTDMYMGTTTAGAPTNIHLGGSSVLEGGSTTSMATIDMVASSLGAYVNPAIQISTAGCTQLNYPPATGCPTTSVTIGGDTYTTVIPAINVLYGDISIPNGELTALKIYSASDARLKTNIHMIQDPLDNLMKIDAVSFELKNGGRKSMGVTAQNLEKVYPELVSQSGGIKYVEYNGLIGPLIGAVQELKRQNDDLREQLRLQNLREDKLEKALKRGNKAP